MEALLQPLRRATPYVRLVVKLLKALWLYIAGVISIVTMYVLLIGVEQGIDVVIQTGEYLWPGIFAIVSVFFWAYVLWFSGRILSYIKQKKDDELYGEESPSGAPSPLYEKYAIPTYMYRHIPRLLAYNCFVVIQLAIFNLPRVLALTGSTLLVLIVFHNLLYFTISEALTPSPLKRRNIFRTISLIMIAGYLSFLIYEVVRYGLALNMNVFDNEPNRHQFWLRLSAMFAFGLQTLSVFFFTERRKKINALLKKNSTSKSVDKSTKLFGAASDYIYAEMSFIKVFNILAAIGALLYLSTVLSITFADNIGPLAFAILGVAILVGLSNFIIVFSIRLNFNLFVLVYLLAIINGNILPEPYAVRLQETNNRNVFHNRPQVQPFLKSWFDQRKELIARDTTKFPVYIVLSNGGASRAGKWVSSVLSHLQDESYRRDPSNTFDKHILAIAGASGGSVGNCVYYSLLKEKLKNDSINFATHSNDFFESDFLTFTLARLLGPDLIRHVVPIPMDDRAAALERALENSYSPLLNQYFGDQFSNVIDYSGKLPILYINSTQVDNGMPGVITSVMLSDSSQRQDILALVDSTSKKDGHGDLKLSTAAILSSRFPYVSPAGKIFDRYFVDGGYFDNSGAGTVLELIQDLGRFLNDSSNRSIKDRLSFHIVHIINSEVVPSPVKDIHPLTNDVLAPVLTLAGIQGSSTSISNGILKSNFLLFTNDTTNAIIQYNLYDKNFGKETEEGLKTPAEKKEERKFEEGYPMSWVISDYQLARMDSALRRYREIEKQWFYFYQKSNR
jgi:hypothetical protein